MVCIFSLIIPTCKSTSHQNLEFCLFMKEVIQSTNIYKLNGGTQICGKFKVVLYNIFLDSV